MTTSTCSANAERLPTERALMAALLADPAGYTGIAGRITPFHFRDRLMRDAFVAVGRATDGTLSIQGGL